MEPIVSIIVPIFNSEGTVERCVNSILKQTLKKIEVILINDGSTDKTEQILDMLAKKDERIKVIHKQNKGQGIARNVGMAIAKGEYIGFVDSDDTIDENMYWIMLEKAVQNAADVVQCNIIDVFSNGKYVVQLPKFEETVSITDRQEYFDEYIFKIRQSFECCNKLVRKKFLTDNGIVFESNSKVFSEDLLFNLDMALKIHKIVFIDNPFYYYYQWSDSHSKKIDIDKIDKLCVLFDIFYSRNSSLRHQTAKIAILILMINLSHILNTDEGIRKAKEIVVREDVKKYLYLSFLSMKKIRHKIIMLMLLYMPVRIKLFIIGFYYTHLK